MAVIQPQDSLTGLMARAPKLDGDRFRGIPGFNAGLVAQLGGTAMTASAGVEAARARADADLKIARLGLKPTFTQRLGAAASILGSGFGRRDRFAGQAMSSLLEQGAPSVTDTLLLLNSSLSGVNQYRAQVEPWTTSRTMAAGWLRGGAATS